MVMYRLLEEERLRRLRQQLGMAEPTEQNAFAEYVPVQRLPSAKPIRAEDLPLTEEAQRLRLLARPQPATGVGSPSEEFRPKPGRSFLEYLTNAEQARIEQQAQEAAVLGGAAKGLVEPVPPEFYSSPLGALAFAPGAGVPIVGGPSLAMAKAAFGGLRAAAPAAAKSYVTAAARGPAAQAVVSVKQATTAGRVIPIRKMTWDELAKVPHSTDQKGQDMVWGKLTDAQFAARQFRNQAGGKATEVVRITDSDKPTWALVQPSPSAPLAQQARRQAIAAGQTELPVAEAVTKAPSTAVPAGGRATEAVAPKAGAAPEVTQPVQPSAAALPPTAAPTRAGPSAPGMAAAAPSAGGVPPPAKPPTAVGGVPPAGEKPFAANIRLSKYPEDIRDPIKEWADAHPTEVQAARRGVRPDTEVQADAKRLVEEMGGDFAKLQKRWKPGEAWNAEETLAIRGTLRTKTDAVLEAAKVARADNSATNHAKLLTAIQEQARVQQIVHGVTAEAGRALRAFRQEAFDAINAGNNQKLEELLRRIGDRAKLDDVAEMLTKLDLNNPVAVNEFIRNVTKPKLWDYVMEVFINSILSGPKTHIINALSNTMNTLASPVERVAAAGVERLLAPIQGRPVARFFSEVPADAFGAVEGIREGVRAGISTLKNGINPAQASKWEFRRLAFKGKLGRIIRAPGTALEAADAVGYSINYRAALNASIVRQARSEGLKGAALTDRVAELKLSPTEALIKEAGRIAEYRLFRQESHFANALLQFRERYPALRFVIPFVRTPVNLVKYGLERSPIGVVNPSLWRNLAAKNPAASDQIGRVFIGSTVAGLLAWQIAEGNLEITGAAPKGEGERDRFYREGKLPFAVRIGGTWIQYQRLEPFNQVFAQVAAAMDAIKSNDKTASEKVAQATFTIGQNLVSQTFFSGLNDLLNMVFEPERYGARYITRLLAAGIPFSAALRTAAQTIDPTIRKPRTAVESLEATIPGLSQRVPSTLTAFGEEAQRQSPAFSPIQITKEQQDAVDAMLEKSGVEVGFVGDSIEGVKLTADQQRDYQILAGRLTYQRLARLTAVPNPNEKVIRKVIGEARDEARARMNSALLRQRAQPSQQKASAPAPSGDADAARLRQLREELDMAEPVGAR